MQIPSHKKIRLDHNLYNQESYICSITICTDNHQPVFQNKQFAKSCVDLLATYTQKHKIPIYAHCFMPDHLHLFLSPSKKKGIIDIVREYKGLTTRLAWSHGIKGTFWQKSFYDHFLRKEEDIEQVANYILNNPVRRGLVPEWKEYPYCGSLVYNL